MLTGEDRERLERDLIESRGQLLALDDTLQVAQALLPGIEVVRVDGAGRAYALGELTPCIRGIRARTKGMGGQPKEAEYSRGESDPNQETWEVPATAQSLFLGRRGVTFRSQGVLYEVERAEEVTDSGVIVKIQLFCQRNQR